jgi:Domain of unknown function (DUF4145)
MAINQWINVQTMTQCGWTCGYCGLSVGGNLGYYKTNFHPQSNQVVGLQPHQANASVPRIVICPHCEKPTYFEGEKQMPGAAFGAEVGHLPADVSGLYKEARNCMSVSAFTASVLATRKLLMNVAASQGAPAGDTFKIYVSFLETNGYVPPNARGWVDHIRDKANDATHQIPSVSEADAKDLLTFMEMILKLVFEFPNRVPGHGAKPAKP